jgi:hypothetical protein
MYKDMHRGEAVDVSACLTKDGRFSTLLAEVVD